MKWLTSVYVCVRVCVWIGVVIHAIHASYLRGAPHPQACPARSAPFQSAELIGDPFPHLITYICANVYMSSKNYNEKFDKNNMNTMQNRYNILSTHTPLPSSQSSAIPRVVIFTGVRVTGPPRRESSLILAKSSATRAVCSASHAERCSSISASFSLALAATAAC